MNYLYIISGLYLEDPNRGTAALGYGAFSFLEENGFITDKDELLIIKGIRSLFSKKEKIEKLNIQGKEIISRTITVPTLYTFLARKFGLLIPFTKFRRYLKHTKFIAAINGGDGFSDIYGDKIFYSRLYETLIGINCGIPVIQLPQTLGPFEKSYNYKIARKILKNSKKIYVRDDKYIKELNKINISYQRTKDLSAYMKPESWEINIQPDSIGINVSGLCYSNKFNNLTGQFDIYPELINAIIALFQSKGKTIYLIPHSYNYDNPEKNNDDIEVSREVYRNLPNKNNVILIDKNLSSPQIKYVISKMSFFVGTRMHANFAAIYSNVPVFGIAYSYKFEGAFNSNGLNGKQQTALINNMTKEDIPQIIQKINIFFENSNKE